MPRTRTSIDQANRSSPVPDMISSRAACTRGYSLAETRLIACVTGLSGAAGSRP
jgi:hypothetical protein